MADIDIDCGDIDCGDCDCGDCDCGDCDCGDCDCGDCNCGDCGGCGDCDCGGCDCDCGGCNCEGGDCLAFLNCLAADHHLHGGYDHDHHHLCLCWPILCCPIGDVGSDEGGNRTRRDRHAHRHHNLDGVVTAQPSTTPAPPQSQDSADAVSDPHNELLVEDPPPTYQEHIEMTRMLPALEDVQPEPRVEDGGVGLREDGGGQPEPRVLVDGGGVGLREDGDVQPEPRVEGGGVGAREDGAPASPITQAGGVEPGDTDTTIMEGGETNPGTDVLESANPSTALVGVPDPSKCYVTVKNSERVPVVGEKCIVFLHAVDAACKPCELSLQSLKCEFVSETADTRESCDVEQKEQSQYEISYQPTIKGKHQLCITIASQHVRGSPFNIAVMSPVEMLGTPIATMGSIGGPLGVTINQRGEVAVADREGHCVSVFSPSGEKLRSFGTHGSGQGQFESPQGVAVDGEGNILVADRENNRIQKFTSEGQFLAAVCATTSASL